MAFDYRKEKLQFEREWARLRKEYEAAGMPPEDIDALHEFDWEWFCSRRRFVNHTQELPGERITGEEGAERSSLIRRFEAFSAALDESLMGGRCGWVEDIEDSALLDKLRRLSGDDLELLTLLVIEGYSQVEAARIRGCSQNAISKKYLRIKKVLK